MITDPRQIRLNKRWFREWLDRNSTSEDDDYKDHAVDVLENWLSVKMPGLRIGNLFRYDDLREYDSFKGTIVSSPSYEFVNENDMNGRPNAALNHYSKYLEDPATGDLKARLNEKYPAGERRVIGGVFGRRL